MNKLKKAYEEILEILKKHEDICIFNINSIEKKIEKHLFGIKLKKEYNFNINPKEIYSLEWNKFGSYMNIGQWGEKYHRTVSYSDNNSQPNNELLLSISFSTGAYIFGNDYPTDLFEKFFNELKSYKPKYSDTTNHCLYFSMNNAGKIFNEFDSILKKYHKINKKNFNQRKIKRMELELKNLKERNNE